MSAQEPKSTTACFSVTASAGPGVLPRILEPFAKRGLVPGRFESHRRDEVLTVDIRMDPMDLELARYIGRCLDRIFEVERVLVSEKRFADVA